MKKISIIFLISVFVLNSFGQNKADSLFSVGGELYEKQDFVGAIKCFKTVILNYKQFKFYNQCIYNLAYTYNTVDSLDQAEFWYEKIRASDVKDNERIGGRGICEPYSNYKHYSTFNIANIEYKRSNFKKALDYYKQCSTKYPYYNESGTDLRINKNRLVLYAFDCFIKLKQYNEALTTIVPEALDSDGSKNHKEVVETAISLIDSNFSKKQIVAELEIAFKTMKRNKNKYWFEFVWRNKSVALYPYAVDNSMTVESFIRKMKQEIFWQQLNN